MKQVPCRAVPPKRRLALNGLHGVISRNIKLVTVQTILLYRTCFQICVFVIRNIYTHLNYIWRRVSEHVTNQYKTQHMWYSNLQKKKHLFLDISSTNIDILVPSFCLCVETRSTEVPWLLSHPLPHLRFNLFVISETFAFLRSASCCYTFFSVRQNTIINNSSTSHVQMGLYL
jgi:hypothetical protein